MNISYQFRYNNEFQSLNPIGHGHGLGYFAHFWGWDDMTLAAWLKYISITTLHIQHELNWKLTKKMNINEYLNCN